MPATIALWWCYVTGAAIALALTALAWWWAIETTLRIAGLTKIVIQWNWERMKAEKAKTSVPG